MQESVHLLMDGQNFCLGRNYDWRESPRPREGGGDVDGQWGVSKDFGPWTLIGLGFRKKDVGAMSFWGEPSPKTRSPMQAPGKKD